MKYKNNNFDVQIYYALIYKTTPLSTQGGKIGQLSKLVYLLISFLTHGLWTK